MECRGQAIKRSGIHIIYAVSDVTIFISISTLGVYLALNREFLDVTALLSNIWINLSLLFGVVGAVMTVMLKIFERSIFLGTAKVPHPVYRRVTRLLWQVALFILALALILLFLLARLT